MQKDIVLLREAVIRRSREIRRQRQARIRHCLSASGAALLIALILFMRSGADMVKENGEVSYGALILSPQFGGYVLVGVICFVIGIAVTALCILRQGKRK